MTTSVWMHIGAGSFHRAHQAWYLHRLMQQGDSRWHIALGNIREDASPLLTQLAAQHWRVCAGNGHAAGRTRL